MRLLIIFLIVIALIIIIVAIIRNAIVKFFMNITKNYNRNISNLENEVIYRKDDIVVLKGEAKSKDKDKRSQEK